MSKYSKYKTKMKKNGRDLDRELHELDRYIERVVVQLRAGNEDASKMPKAPDMFASVPHVVAVIGIPAPFDGERLDHVAGTLGANRARRVVQESVDAHFAGVAVAYVSPKFIGWSDPNIPFAVHAVGVPSPDLEAFKNGWLSSYRSLMAVVRRAVDSAAIDPSTVN